MADRNWNPSEPTVLGLEWSGMRYIEAPLSQDVEYGHTFESNAAQTVDTALFMVVEPVVSFLTVCTPLVTVYERGEETAVGTPTTTVCAVNGGALAGAAALGGGAASITAALASPADEGYVDLPFTGSNEVTLEFATNGVFTGKRILEVKVRYVATAQNVIEGELERIQFILSTGATIGLYGHVQIERAGTTDLPIRTLSLGECNHVQAGSEVWPWTPTELDGFDNSTFDVRFLGSEITLGFNARLHYAALEVVWCEENRVAVGGLAMRQGKEVPTLGPHTVHLRTPGGTDNWSKALDTWYTVTVTSARSPGPFANTTSDNDVASPNMRQTQGPQPSTALMDGFDVWPTHAGRVAPRAATGVLSSADDDSRLCPVVFNTTAPAMTTDSDPYHYPIAAPVYSGGSTVVQEIEERSTGAGVEYEWSTIYVRKIGTITTDLTLTWTPSAGGATATAITSATIDAADEIFDGWKRILHRWTPGPVILSGAADGQLAFTTAGGDIANRYEILGAYAGGAATFLGGGLSGGPSSYGGSDTTYIQGGVAGTHQDLIVMFHAEVPTPANFSGSVVTSAISGRSSADVCQVTEFDYVSLNWDDTTVATEDFAYYEVQRKDTVNTTYETVAKITTKTTSQFFDLEARLGVASTYRVRTVRVDGAYSDWTAEETETPTTQIDSDNCGFLFFSTNEYTGYIYVWSDSYEADPTAAYQFVEADDYVLARHYGRDYTQSFHGTERGGVSFERTLLINAVDAPARHGDHDFDPLRDLAYADLPYVCVRDDLGNRWFATIIVPQATVRRPGSIELATVRVIESTDTPWPADNQFAL